MTASRIKKMRRSLKWTQKKMAEWFDVDVRTVQNWEQKGCSTAVWKALQGVK